MTDINFMLPDSVPLLSAATLKAALTQRPAATGAAAPVPDGSASADDTLTVQVSSSQPRPPGWLLTLSSQPTANSPANSLQVRSEWPLPTGTQLTLQLPPGNSAQPANSHQTLLLTVLSVQLPQNNSSQNSGSTRNDVLSLLTGFLATRLALLSPQPASSLSGQLPLAGQTATPASASNRPTGTADVYTRPQSGMNNPVPPPAAANPLNPLLVILQSLAKQPGAPGSQLPQGVSAGLPAGLSGAVSTSNITQATPGTSASAPLLNLSAGSGSAPVSTPLPTAVLQILQQWQQQLPQPQQLTQPDGVKHAIHNSGLSYEHRLFAALGQAPVSDRNATSAPELFRSLWQRATAAMETAASNKVAQPIGVSDLLSALKTRLEQPAATTPTVAAEAEPALQLPSLLQSLLGSDHKAVLGRALLIWAQQIQAQADPNGPVSRHLPVLPQTDMPDTFRLLQTALAQTETEQVSRLQQGDNWQLQIPLFYRDGETPREVRMWLSRDERDEQTSERQEKAVRWRLRLHFDLQQLGPLDIDLELQLPALTATFWSQQTQTLGLLNRELQPLRQRLQALGVDVKDLQVRHGQLPEPERNRISQRLIDTHS